jgi:uncharacterized protein YprB with RNaseH-like and TPR domain
MRKVKGPKSKIQRLTLEEVSEGASVGVWDLECTSLNAGFGTVLCSGLAPLSATKASEVQVWRIDDFHDDSRHWWKDGPLLKQIVKELNQYEYIVGFNTKWYDVAFLDTRLIKWGIQRMLGTIKHVDVFQFGRKRLRVNNRSQQALITHLQCEHNKTPLTPLIWSKAQFGNVSALNQIEEHNVADVLSLAEATRKLLLVTSIPWQYIR